MLTCQLFMRAVNGTLCYRGTVEDGSITLWEGPWRTSRWRAMQDADHAARDIDVERRRGQAVAEGKIGHIWRLNKERH